MENNLIELAHTYFDEESYMQLASQRETQRGKGEKGNADHYSVPLFGPG